MIASGDPIPAGPVPVRGVLDERNVVSGRDRPQSIYAPGVSRDVDVNNRSGVWRDSRLHSIRIQAESVRLDVHGDGNGIDEEHGSGGGDECVVGDNDFVAITNPQSGEDWVPFVTATACRVL